MRTILSIYRYIVNWNIAEMAHEWEKWRNIGTKQTRPLHQTREFRNCLLALNFARSEREERLRTHTRASRKKMEQGGKKKGDQRKQLATVLHVMSFPASSCIRFILPSLIPPRVFAIYSSYFITRSRNKNILQTFWFWTFDLALSFRTKQNSSIFCIYYVMQNNEYNNTKLKLN